METDEKIFGALKIKMKKAPDRTVLSIIGKSEDREPSDVLTPYFEEVVQGLKGPISVEFKKLEFMNSSTVPPLLQFIKRLEESEIKSTFIYNRDSKWQAASFKALATIASTLKFITVEGV